MGGRPSPCKWSEGKTKLRELHRRVQNWFAHRCHSSTTCCRSWQAVRDCTAPQRYLERRSDSIVSAVEPPVCQGQCSVTPVPHEASLGIPNQSLPDKIGSHRSASHVKSIKTAFLLPNSRSCGYHGSDAVRISARSKRTALKGRTVQRLFHVVRQSCGATLSMTEREHDFLFYV